MKHQMKNMILVLVLSLSGLLGTGCATLLQPAPGESVSYHAGRDITVAYLLGKDKLEEKHKQTVKEVYDVFSEVTATLDAEDLSGFKEQLKTILRARITDDKAYALAAHLLNKYWGRLTATVDWALLKNDERVKVLQDFKKGIEDSLEEYSFLL